VPGFSIRSGQQTPLLLCPITGPSPADVCLLRLAWEGGAKGNKPHNVVSRLGGMNEKISLSGLHQVNAVSDLRECGFPYLAFLQFLVDETNDLIGESHDAGFRGIDDFDFPRARAAIPATFQTAPEDETGSSNDE
jgi:hypothetical protein